MLLLEDNNFAVLNKRQYEANSTVMLSLMEIMTLHRR